MFYKYILFQLPISSQREIKILQLLKHENVINLIEICRTKDTTSILHSTTFYLVLDFCEHDLYRLLSNTLVMFTLGDIKSVLQQMLNGLSYIHSNKVSEIIFLVLARILIIIIT